MRPFGLVLVSTTTNITTDNAIVSTELADWYSNNDRLNGWFASIVLDDDGGTPANGLGTTVRRITDYVASSGTLTVAGAVLSAEDEAVEVDLYKFFHPVNILRAFNRARLDVFPLSGIVRDLQTIVTAPDQTVYTVPSTIRRILAVDYGYRRPAASVPENLISNPGFENWASATSLDDWTLSGTGASVNQESANVTPRNHMVLEGQFSARIAVPGSTLVNLARTETPSIAAEGVELNASMWVYCTVASRVTLAVYDGNSYVVGDTHGGTGWERLTVSANTEQTTTGVGMQVSISNDTATVALYLDEAVLVAGPSEGWDEPFEPVENFEFVPAVAGASEFGKLYLAEALPYPRRIRIKGMDSLSAITLDASTFEIDGEQLEPLYNLTRSYLCQDAVGLTTGDMKIEWQRQQSGFRNAFEEGIAGNGRLRVPNRRTRTPDLVY